jgi:hypothetical protein
VVRSEEEIKVKEWVNHTQVPTLKYQYLKVQVACRESSDLAKFSGVSGSTYSNGAKGKPLAPQNQKSLGRWSSSTMAGKGKTMFTKPGR